MDGGRLQGSLGTAGVPERIIIYMRDHKIMKRECRVVWRSSQEIGVQFLTAPQIIRRKDIMAVERLLGLPRHRL